MRRQLFPGFAIGLVSAFLVACGSSPGGSSGTGPSQVTISAISGPNHLQIGVNSPGTYVYSAAVSGSADTSITWSVSDTSLASIVSATGVATPSTTKTGAATITATANADTTKASILQVQVVDWILAGQPQDVDGVPAGLAVAVVNSDGTDPVTLIPLRCSLRRLNTLTASGLTTT
ncbi:MAG TPA: hypothetical protein VEN79_04140 [Terriglobia bacterium]|nr:hypothetical protein [Terriglobia bacterium]